MAVQCVCWLAVVFIREQWGAGGTSGSLTPSGGKGTLGAGALISKIVHQIAMLCHLLTCFEQEILKSPSTGNNIPFVDIS